MTLPQIDDPSTRSLQLDMPEDENQWVLPPIKNCLFLTGPTSSGKTQLAIELAQRLGADIFSLDSMAIYRGMNIGTAKPSPEQRALVPHHLLDIVEPTESFSVSSYVTKAHEIAADVLASGRRVLFCGGTPLYLKSLLRGLFLGPEADWEFRDSVEKDIEKYGEDAFRERLMQVDPLLAHKLHPHDHRRAIRALEVARITGRPLSHWQQQFETPSRNCSVAVLQLDRSWLHQRINSRVDAMLAEGLMDEVKQLQADYTDLGRTARQAVGYREVLEHFEGGTTIDEMTELIKAHTRQFARRQEIWFRGLSELKGIEVTPESTTDQLSDLVMDIFQSTDP
ncbi:MAG: tRNA (adenosine(37)-N6)-dimethylallyltransferase MiaA [Aureliella sp.]